MAATTQSTSKMSDNVSDPDPPTEQNMDSEPPSDPEPLELDPIVHDTVLGGGWSRDEQASEVDGD